METNAVEYFQAKLKLSHGKPVFFSREEMRGAMVTAFNAGLIVRESCGRTRPCPFCQDGEIMFGPPDENGICSGRCPECGGYDTAAENAFLRYGLSEEGTASYLSGVICGSDSPEKHGGYWNLGTAIIARHPGSVFFAMSPDTATCVDLLKQKAARLAVFNIPGGIDEQYMPRVISIDRLLHVDGEHIRVHDEAMDVEGLVYGNESKNTQGDSWKFRQMRLREFLCEKADHFRKQFILSEGRKQPPRLLLKDLVPEFLDTLPDKAKTAENTVRRDLIQMTGCRLGKDGKLKKAPPGDKDLKPERFDAGAYLALVKYDDVEFLAGDNPLLEIVREAIQKLASPGLAEDYLKQLELNKEYNSLKCNVVKDSRNSDELRERLLNLSPSELLVIRKVSGDILQEMGVAA